ncbi:hypothetical protein L1O48_07605 [Ligilactobacillus equi]|uniref:hypothetical protein n=1 Tax=Ligilactobacillus equi TaxID=137357 RepID=UPI002ED4E27F
MTTKTYNNELMRQWYVEQIGRISQEYGELLRKDIYAEVRNNEDEMKQILEEIVAELDGGLRFGHRIRTDIKKRQLKITSSRTEKIVTITIELAENFMPIYTLRTSGVKKTRRYEGLKAWSQMATYINQYFAQAENYFFEERRTELESLMEQTFNELAPENEFSREITIKDSVVLATSYVAEMTYIALLRPQKFSKNLDLLILALPGEKHFQIDESRITSDMYEDLYYGLVHYGLCQDWWYRTVSDDLTSETEKFKSHSLYYKAGAIALEER